MAHLRMGLRAFLRPTPRFLRPSPSLLRTSPIMQRRLASSDSQSKIDPYEVFEGSVHPDSSAEEIKEAYRELVKRYHPDSNPDIDRTKITEIYEAYQMLMKQDIKNKVKTGFFSRSEGDEPPVPRSELHERVYKPAETRWEEQTQMMLFKIKKRYGRVVYGITYVLFHVFQFLRQYRALVAIMGLGFVFQTIKSYMAQKHMQDIKKRREKALLTQEA